MILYIYPLLHQDKDCIENNIEPVNVTWAGYHANISIHVKQTIAKFCNAALFKHATHEATKIHCLSVAEVATKHLNPKHCPVITFDEPQYASTLEAN